MKNNKYNTPKIASAKSVTKSAKKPNQRRNLFPFFLFLCLFITFSTKLGNSSIFLEDKENIFTSYIPQNPDAPIFPYDVYLHNDVLKEYAQLMTVEDTLSLDYNTTFLSIVHDDFILNDGEGEIYLAHFASPLFEIAKARTFQAPTFQTPTEQQPPSILFSPSEGGTVVLEPLPFLSEIEAERQLQLEKEQEALRLMKAEQEALSRQEILKNIQDKTQNAQLALEGFSVAYQDNEKIISKKVMQGESFKAIMTGWMSDANINKAINTANSVHRMGSIHENRYYHIILDERGHLKRFEYEIRNSSNMLVIKAVPQQHIQKNEVEILLNPKEVDYSFHAEVTPIPYTIELVHLKDYISQGSSYSYTVLKAGGDDELAVNLTELFDHQVDYFRVQPNDSFEVLVEKRYLYGRPKGFGKILATSFNYANKKTKHEAFAFSDGKSKKELYYDRAGEPIELALLKAPLDYKRISSGFTYTRRHPILGIVRPHLGIDYAAPTGTPVRTVGNGSVTYAGWLGGYGYTVIVKHNNTGYETQYAHLSKITVKKGERLVKGQTIGNVGSTGMSTGPHLDYRVKYNGKFVNPDSVTRIDTGDKLTAKKKEEFAHVVTYIDSFLDGTRSFANYASEKSITENVALAMTENILEENSGEKSEDNSDMNILPAHNSSTQEEENSAKNI